MTLLLLLDDAGGGDQTIGLDGIASGEDLTQGVENVASLTLEPGGIASGEAVGAPNVVPGAVTIALDGIASGEAVGAPNVYEPHTVELPSIASEPNVPGPTFSQTYPAGAADVPRMRAWLYEDDLTTLVRELDESFDKGWDDPMSEPGSWSATLPNGDPDAADCTTGRVVRLDLDGLACFPGLIEGKTIRTVAQGEEVEQTTVVKGRSTLAMWEDALVFPEGGADSRPFADDRLFDYGSGDLDDGAWPAVRDVAYDGVNGAPQGWPDTSARKITPDPYAPTALFPPGGDSYVRATLDLTGAAEPLTYRFFVTADDGFQVKVDGVVVGEETRAFMWQETRVFDVVLSPGVHQVAARVANLDRPDDSTNVSWFMLSVYELVNAVPTTVVLRTDPSWVGIADPPTPPGFTPGEVIRVLLEEAQARGLLTGWTLGFTDDVDSDGNAWPVTAELAFRVGLDGVAVLRQLAETYCDFGVAPAVLRLDAWNIGDRGATTGVALAAASNVMEMTHEVAG